MSAPAVQLAGLNIRKNGLKNCVLWQGDGLSAAREAAFDTVLCNPPVRAGNAVIARMFDDAQRGLKPGGSLWVVLRTAQGAKSWEKRLAGLFGHCETVTKEDGYRILRSEKER